jgi:hypothetical protein
MAVLPSAESATEEPWEAGPEAPLPTSFCCWVQVVPLRLKTHAAPVKLLSWSAPTIAVLPSAERRRCLARHLQPRRCRPASPPVA